ncbi:MAG: hypothetical protein ACE37F_05425 [Nannocystaceae bacterium]
MRLAVGLVVASFGLLGGDLFLLLLQLGLVGLDELLLSLAHLGAGLHQLSPRVVLDLLDLALRALDHLLQLVDAVGVHDRVLELVSRGPKLPPELGDAAEHLGQLAGVEQHQRHNRDDHHLRGADAEEGHAATIAALRGASERPPLPDPAEENEKARHHRRMPRFLRQGLGASRLRTPLRGAR